MGNNGKIGPTQKTNNKKNTKLGKFQTENKTTIVTKPAPKSYYQCFICDANLIDKLQVKLHMKTHGICIKIAEID